MLALLLAALQAAFLICQTWEFFNSGFELTLPKHSVLRLPLFKNGGIYACAIKLSPPNNELQLPGCCHIQSSFWQDWMQVPEWREPQFELKPIHQSCKRLSGSTVQVPLTRAFILHPHI